MGITGRLVHADGKEEVLAVGDEVWEEWSWAAVEDTDWRKGGEGRMGSQGESSIKEGSTQGCGQGPSIRQGVNRQWVWEKGSPGLLAAALSHFFLY